MRLFILLLFACSISACKCSKSLVKDSYAIDKIQLQLSKKMKPSRIQNSFESLGVKYLCTLDKDQNINVYSFDLKQKSLTEMIAFLNNEVGVIKAERTKGCQN